MMLEGIAKDYRATSGLFNPSSISVLFEFVLPHLLMPLQAGYLWLFCRIKQAEVSKNTHFTTSSVVLLLPRCSSSVTLFSTIPS